MSSTETTALVTENSSPAFSLRMESGESHSKKLRLEEEPRQSTPTTAVCSIAPSPLLEQVVAGIRKNISTNSAPHSPTSTVSDSSPLIPQISKSRSLSMSIVLPSTSMGSQSVDFPSCSQKSSAFVANLDQTEMNTQTGAMLSEPSFNLNVELFPMNGSTQISAMSSFSSYADRRSEELSNPELVTASNLSTQTALTRFYLNYLNNIYSRDKNISMENCLQY